MPIHYADVSASPRLQAIVGVLTSAGREGATTMEIQDRADSCAVGTCISELRRNGYRIDCAYERLSDTGRKIYRYTLIST